MAAENYHLKWDSHLSYLNSSVATLYKNEKFADVVLYSSSSSCASGNSSENGIPTVGISAHKFILSSCSQFFATMFETSPISSPNGILYIVLPPDLSHRAIQILVQYMYSGEATVANDILSEVLRGGEILKIRGLCRTSSTSINSHNQPQRAETQVNNSGGPHYIQNAANRQAPHSSISHTHIPGDMYVVNKCPTGGNSSCGTRYTMEHLQQLSTQSAQHSQPSHVQQIQGTHPQFRGLGASVLPKDSPVIVKSPKLSQLRLLSAAASSSKHLTGGGISVNKEVAIDPDDKCCYQLNQLQVATTLCNEMGCSGDCPMSMDDDQLRRRRRNQNEEDIRASVVEQRLEREYSERPRPPPDEQDQREDINIANYDSHIHRGSEDRIRDYFLSEPYEHTDTTPTKSNHHFSEQVSRGLTNTSPMSQVQSFVTIKQEPADWTAPTSASVNALSELSRPPKTPLNSPKQSLDYKIPSSGTTVKLEIGAHSHSPRNEQDATGQDSNEYDAPLACESCKQSFDEPKSWVRHLESHTVNTTSTDSVAINMPCGTTNSSGGNTATTILNGGESLAKAYVPKKRRRVSQQESNAAHVTLCCDLCSISFETPAEWVRHLNNEHTEIELAMFNSKKDNEQKSSCNSNQQHAHHKRFTHRSTYDQPANETQAATVSPAAPSIPNFSERSEACEKKFSTHSSGLMHKRSHNTPNGLSISVSTSVAPTVLPPNASDVSVISSVTTTSLPNEQISTSSQA